MRQKVKGPFKMKKFSGFGEGTGKKASPTKLGQLFSSFGGSPQTVGNSGGVAPSSGATTGTANSAGSGPALSGGLAAALAAINAAGAANQPNTSTGVVDGSQVTGSFNPSSTTSGTSSGGTTQRRPVRSRFKRRR